MWTHFWDMHSGGEQKLQWTNIFVEADETEAKKFFEQAFHRDPDNVTCSCCGGDYSISSSDESLEQVTGYHRHCAGVYISPTGEEVTSGEASEAGKGTKEGFKFTYVERQRYFEFSPEVPDGKYQTLEEFELDENVLIVRRIKELGETKRLQLTSGEI